MPRALALALAVVLGLTATGCADEAPPGRAKDGTVAITLDDFLIRPQTVRATGGKLTFRIVNEGKVGHTFHVLLGEREALAVRTIPPGGSAVASGTFKPGSYKMVCVLGNHEDLGMYGTLVVR